MTHQLGPSTRFSYKPPSHHLEHWWPSSTLETCLLDAMNTMADQKVPQITQHISELVLDYEAKAD